MDGATWFSCSSSAGHSCHSWRFWRCHTNTATNYPSKADKQNIFAIPQNRPPMNCSVPLLFVFSISSDHEMNQKAEKQTHIKTCSEHVLNRNEAHDGLLQLGSLAKVVHPPKAALQQVCHGFHRSMPRVVETAAVEPGMLQGFGSRGPHLWLLMQPRKRVGCWKFDEVWDAS